MNSVLVALTAVAATAGLVFNGYVLLVLVWQRRFHTANHLLLLHLAIVDLLFCFLLLLGNTPLAILAQNGQDAPRALGIAQGLLWQTLPTVLAWTICGLSCDRYAAICSPFTYFKLVSTRRAAAFLALTWLVLVTLAMGPFFGFCTYKFDPVRASFAIACSPRESHFALIYAALAALIPVTVIVACNTHILLIARNQRHQIVTALYEVTLRATAAATAVSGSCPESHPHQLNHPHHHHSSVSGVSGKVPGGGGGSQRGGDALLAMLVASQLLLFAPSYVLLVLESFAVHLSPDLVSVTCLLLALIPAVNAYVYGVKSRLVRQTFKRLFQRYLYQQQASIEIDRRLSLRSQSSLRAAVGWHSFLTSSQNSLQTGTKLAGGKLRRNSAPSFSSTGGCHILLGSGGQGTLGLDPQRASSVMAHRQSFRRLSLNHFSTVPTDPGTGGNGGSASSSSFESASSPHKREQNQSSVRPGLSSLLGSSSSSSSSKSHDYHQHQLEQRKQSQLLQLLSVDSTTACGLRATKQALSPIAEVSSCCGSVAGQAQVFDLANSTATCVQNDHCPDQRLIYS